MAIVHLALAMAISHWLWLLAMHISHRLWLLTIDICTKKCGYGYNPFWLLAIVNCLQLLVVGYSLFNIFYFDL